MKIRLGRRKCDGNYQACFDDRKWNPQDGFEDIGISILASIKVLRFNEHYEGPPLKKGQVKTLKGKFKYEFEE